MIPAVKYNTRVGLGCDNQWLVAQKMKRGLRVVRRAKRPEGAPVRSVETSIKYLSVELSVEVSVALTGTSRSLHGRSVVTTGTVLSHSTDISGRGISLARNFLFFSRRSLRSSVGFLVPRCGGCMVRAAA